MAKKRTAVEKRNGIQGKEKKINRTSAEMPVTRSAAKRKLSEKVNGGKGDCMPVTRSAAKRKLNEKVNGGKGDYFDLLGCPDEIIEHIFSYLSVEDRMSARMNKRLNNIEAKSKYYLKKVELKQPFRGKYVIINNRKNSIDFIRRIANNASIGFLEIDSPNDSDTVARKFFNIIKEFRCIRKFRIRFREFSCITTKEILTDSFFLDLSRRCEFLDIIGSRFDKISPEILHNLYKSMKDGSISVWRVSLSYVTLEIIRAFHTLIGITFRDGRVVTNRNIEVYKEYDVDIESTYFVNIFDGFVHIVFRCSTPDSETFLRKIEIKVYKNLEALTCAKNAPPKEGFVRVRRAVYPE